MKDIGEDEKTKKWKDLIESNRKLVTFAMKQLKEGHIINAKSILDSLVKNHQLKTQQYPINLTQ